MKNSKSYLIKAFISFIILAFLVYKIGAGSIYDAFSKFGWIWVLPILFVQFIIVFMEGLGIKILLDHITNKRFCRLIRYYFLCWALGSFIPGKMGQLLIIPLLKDDGISVGQSTAVLIMDKLITFLVLSIMTIMALLIFFPFVSSKYLIVIIVVGFIISLFLFLSNTGRMFIKNYILRKYSILFKGFHKNLIKLMLKYPFSIFLNTALTLAKMILSALILYMIFVAFHYPIGFYEIFFITPVGMIVSLIPIGLNGLGIRELSVVALYGYLGVPSNIVISTYFIYLLISYIIVVVVISLFFGDLAKIKKNFSAIKAKL